LCASLPQSIMPRYPVPIRQYQQRSLAYFSPTLTSSNLATYFASGRYPSASGTFTLWDVQPFGLYSPYEAHTLCMCQFGLNTQTAYTRYVRWQKIKTNTNMKNTFYLKVLLWLGCLYVYPWAAFTQILDDFENGSLNGWYSEGDGTESLSTGLGNPGASLKVDDNATGVSTMQLLRVAI